MEKLTTHISWKNGLLKEPTPTIVTLQRRRIFPTAFIVPVAIASLFTAIETGSGVVGLGCAPQ